MGVLEAISGPADLRRLSEVQVRALAAEIRRFLISNVSRTGGHLGPNLGVVELTLAVHRVFDSPRDRILFDTGHQAYVHKILTGRAGAFPTLRQQGGLSGYPSRAESVHDVIENSHASTALSYADGIAKAFACSGQTDRHVVAVVGDGALTGGMAWEALNTIAAAPDRPVVIVVNDNQRSYAPTIGGLAAHLDTLRTTRGYERFLTWGKQALARTPVVGPPVYGTLHGVKKGLKDMVAPQGMFEDLGLKYVGPVDGHDVVALERALRQARRYHGPVIVHALTRKGLGYPPAEHDDADRFHSVRAIDPRSGRPLSVPPADWTSVFGDEMLAVGVTRPDVVAITAAMLIPTGLDRFATAFPGRVYDVGIAEQHAVASAAGLALEGFHPVVAVYSTFLNRAFDQVLMDVALHRAPVTFVLDRAGVTGDDGPSHNGMWDLAILGIVPGLRIAAPRDGDRLREQLRAAVDVTDGPTVVRFPKGPVSPVVPARRRVGGVDVLREPAPPAASDVLCVTVGPMAALGLEVADRAAGQGVEVTVVDPCWVRPVPDELVEMARHHRLVVTVEDGVRGGFGAALSAALRDNELDVPLREFALPDAFLAQGSRAQVLAAAGLTGQTVARRIVEAMARLDLSAGGTPASALAPRAGEGFDADAAPGADGTDPRA
jgi:1-deoxy-D-xylulose-5-phosphate synthase